MGRQKELLLRDSQKKSGRDGVRAWLVAFANFFINFLVVGLGRMSGILYVVFMSKFHIDRKTASIPFSIQQATRNFFGPLAGILGQKYGVRNVTILGGVIGTFSAMACFFVMNITWITVLWGFLFGICTALTTTLNQIPIDQYFDRHRTTAGGLAFSGGCVAAFIFPVILETLIQDYGMARTFLAMGIFTFFVIPNAFLLAEPPWIKKELQALDDDDRIKRTSNKLTNYNTFDSKDSTTTKFKRSDFEFLKQNSELVSQLFVLTIPDEVVLSEPFQEDFFKCSDNLPLVNELENLYNAAFSENGNESAADNLNKKSVQVVEVTINGFPKQNSTDFSREDQENKGQSKNEARRHFIAGKLKELCGFNDKMILLYFPSDMHVEVLKLLCILRQLRTEIDRPPLDDPLPDPESPDPELPTKKELPNSFVDHMRTAIRLHTNPLFLLICLCRGVFMLTFIPLVTIIVDFAMDKGLQQSTGKYVIAILSMGDLLGRLCLGWINDIGCLSLPRYMLVVMLLLAASTATLPLMHSEVSLMPAILVFGMLQGSLFIRHQILVSKYLGSREQAIGMGFINLLSGFIGFALPFYIGYFRDTQGSYDNMFYVNGGICAFIGLLWIFEPYLVRFSSTDETRIKQ